METTRQPTRTTKYAAAPSLLGNELAKVCDQLDELRELTLDGDDIQQRLADAISDLGRAIAGADYDPRYVRA